MQTMDNKELFSEIDEELPEINCKTSINPIENCPKILDRYFSKSNM